MLSKPNLQRLIKTEDRIKQAIDDLGLDVYPIEFDVIPPQKMLEIMAYNIPTNISNWKFGRNYERQRTIYDHHGYLPFEVVINSNPARAYLMNNNKYAIQCLVISHVYGHVTFFTNNKYFVESRQDIMNIMAEASKRFNKYERKYGIKEVEKTIDAAHALQFHSSPFEKKETEKEKRLRVFDQMKKVLSSKSGEFNYILGSKKENIKEDIALHNQKLWRKLKNKTPVEPTEDILGYVIDNAPLEDWQIDILETLRTEGQYYWPVMKTKTMNEGFATFLHEKIMKILFDEEYLDSSDHADFAYTNALVKANSIGQLNPYLLGSAIWKNIEERWDKGQYGEEWDNCTNIKDRKEWDTEEKLGWEKCKEIMESYFDWFFIHDFLTIDLIKDMNIFLFEAVDKEQHVDYVITHDDAEKIKQYIIKLFAQTVVPDIEIIDGNYNKNNTLMLKHKYDGIPLDKIYTKKTMEHICYLWGNDVTLVSDDETFEVK